MLLLKPDQKLIGHKRATMAWIEKSKKNGRLEVRAYGGINKITGKKIPLYLKPSLPADATEEEQAAALAKLDKRAKWSKARQSDLTVEAVLEYRLDKLSASKTAASTIEAYRSYVNCYIVPFIGDDKMEDVYSPTFVSLYDRLTEKGGKDKHPISANTLRKFHIFLRASFRDLCSEGIIDHNPVESIKTPSPEKTEAIPLCEEDFISFDEYVCIQEDPLDVALRLVFYTGIRRSEVAGLRVRDFDSLGASISIMKPLTRSKKKGESYEPNDPKSKKFRKIDLDDETASAVRAHLSRQRQLLTGNNIRQSAKTPLFARSDGSAYRPDTYNNHFKKVAKRLEIDPDATLHTLRHTHATYLLMEGFDMKTLSERLGHWSPAVTLEVYGHVMPGRNAAAAFKFAGITQKLKGRNNNE